MVLSHRFSYIIFIIYNSIWIDRHEIWTFANMKERNDKLKRIVSVFEPRDLNKHRANMNFDRQLGKRYAWTKHIVIHGRPFFFLSTILVPRISVIVYKTITNQKTSRNFSAFALVDEFKQWTFGLSVWVKLVTNSYFSSIWWWNMSNDSKWHCQVGIVEK